MSVTTINEEEIPKSIKASDFIVLATDQSEILGIFTRTRALLEGHFVLRSGLHSGHYFQCAQVCQRMDAVERLAELLLAKVQGHAFTTVLAPAMGGLVIGQEVARQAKARYLFAEKENNVLVLRRGFTFTPGERVLIVEDELQASEESNHRQTQIFRRLQSGCEELDHAGFRRVLS